MNFAVKLVENPQLVTVYNVTASYPVNWSSVSFLESV